MNMLVIFKEVKILSMFMSHLFKWEKILWSLNTFKSCMALSFEMFVWLWVFFFYNIITFYVYKRI